MTKTKKIIIFVVVVIMIGLAGWWIYSKNTNTDVRVGNSGFSIKNFFPFGQAPENTTNQNNGGENGTSGNNSSGSTSNTDNNSNRDAVNVPIKKLRKLWDKPVAGTVMWSKLGTSTIRFVEKATGNVYEARSDLAQVKRLTNNTIPKIMRAFWLPDGSGFLAQTVDENEIINTSFIKWKLSASSTSGSIPYNVLVSKLPTGIMELSVAPDSKKIFYLTALGTAKGFVSNPDGTNPTQIYSNYLTEWIPNWFGDKILLSSKASFSAISSGFFLNPNTKTLVKAYDNISGASALSRVDGKFVLLGSGGDSYGISPKLWVENVSTGSVSPLNIETFAEKCAWNKADSKFIFCGVPKTIGSGNYPDSWYQGSLSTDDIIQKINVFDLYRYVLVDLSRESSEQIDTENLMASSDGNFLIFQNKLDQSLWLLDTR